MSGAEFLIPLAVGIGGQLIQGGMQKSAYKDADKQRARILEQQGITAKNTREKNLAIEQDAVKQFDPATREQSLTKAEDASTGALIEYFRANR